MENNFKQIRPEDLTDNVFKLIGKDWMLITAGNINKFNTMTASWGMLGVLWHKPVFTVFVRHNRYTYEFIEANNYFTLSFLDKEHRDILQLCGTTSGRETDKIKESGLKPIKTDKGNITYEQARLVVECKKIYYNDLVPSNFLSEGINDLYPLKDYHRLFIGEIDQCYIKK